MHAFTSRPARAFLFATLVTSDACTGDGLGTRPPSDIAREYLNAVLTGCGKIDGEPRLSG